MNTLNQVLYRLDNAVSIEQVEAALEPAKVLKGQEAKAFLAGLAAYFNERTTNAAIFQVTHVHPLDARDLRRGFHIGFRS